MRLYAGSTLQLFDDVARRSIAGQLKQAYFGYYGYKPSDEEVGSWENSITALAGVFEDAGLEDHAVAIEYRLPLTSCRIDCMVMGKDDDRRDNAPDYSHPLAEAEEVIVTTQFPGSFEFHVLDQREKRGDRLEPVTALRLPRGCATLLRHMALST